MHLFLGATAPGTLALFLFLFLLLLLLLLLFYPPHPPSVPSTHPALPLYSEDTLQRLLDGREDECGNVVERKVEESTEKGRKEGATVRRKGVREQWKREGGAGEGDEEEGRGRGL